MTRLDEAIAIAKQILQENSDQQWAAPLAREFLKLLERRKEAWDGLDAHGRDVATGLLVPQRILRALMP